MARAKTAAFDPALVRTAGLAKALAHPVRILILEILAKRRTCVCGCLVDLLPLAQSTVSQHLTELRDARLIRGETDGRRTCYCLDQETVAEARTALVGLFSGLGAVSLDEQTGPGPVSCRPRAPRPRTRRAGSGLEKHAPAKIPKRR